MRAIRPRRSDPDAPQANVEVSDTLEGKPINGTVVVARSEGAVRIDPLRLQIADNLISGTLVLDEAFRPKGEVELDLKDIGSLSALALQAVTGRGSGTIVLMCATPCRSPTSRWHFRNYLNDRIYLGIECGGSAGSGKARIDLDIGKGIKLRGEAGSDGETKGGIFYELEY